MGREEVVHRVREVRPDGVDEGALRVAAGVGMVGPVDDQGLDDRSTVGAVVAQHGVGVAPQPEDTAETGQSAVAHARVAAGVPCTASWLTVDDGVAGTEPLASLQVR